MQDDSSFAFIAITFGALAVFLIGYWFGKAKWPKWPLLLAIGLSIPPLLWFSLVQLPSFRQSISGFGEAFAIGALLFNSVIFIGPLAVVMWIYSVGRLAKYFSERQSTQ